MSVCIDYTGELTPSAIEMCKKFVINWIDRDVKIFYDKKFQVFTKKYTTEEVEKALETKAFSYSTFDDYS